MPRIYSSPVQDAILEFITDYKRENDGNSPSYQEIATAIGSCAANVYRYVQSLERKQAVSVNKKGKLTLPGGKYIPPE